MASAKDKSALDPMEGLQEHGEEQENGVDLSSISASTALVSPSEAEFDLLTARLGEGALP